MAEPSLNELIEQLTRLRIQEARVLEQIVEAAHREEREQARTAHTAVPGRRNAHRNVFQPGDRVQITNGVRTGQATNGVGPGGAPTTSHTRCSRKQHHVNNHADR